MPAQSSKQYGMMAAIAFGKNKKRALSPSKEVAREFIEKTPPKKRSEFMRNIRSKK